MASTIRISEDAHDVLRQLSETKGITLQDALDVVTADWKRRQFFRHLNDSFAALRADPEAWNEEQEERRLWDNTLSDDLLEEDESNKS